MTWDKFVAVYNAASPVSKMGENTQSNDHSEDKPQGESRNHGNLSEKPRPDGPVDHDVPDDEVIERTLPRTPIGPGDV